MYAAVSDNQSGGQYHWVSEFAPRKFQKILSYIVGMLLLVKMDGC
jgi:hypothetical protein